MFVEDRRSSSGAFRRRPRRGARLGTPAWRGDSRRARRDDGIRAHRRPLASRARRGRASRGGRVHRVRRRRSRVVALSGTTRLRRTARRCCPRRSRSTRKVALLARADAAGAGTERRIRQVSVLVRRRAPPHRRRQLRRPARRRRPGAHPDHGALRREGDTGMQTGHEAPGRTMGFELFDDVRARGRRAQRGRRALTLLDAVPAPTGRIPGRAAPRRGRRAVPRGVRARPRGRPHPKDASVFKDRVGEQVASPFVTLVDDGALRARVGHDRDRRRGHAGAAQRAHRPRRAHRVHVGRRACARGGPAAAAATAGARPTATSRWSA